MIGGVIQLRRTEVWSGWYLRANGLQLGICKRSNPPNFVRLQLDPFLGTFAGINNTTTILHANI